jgi:hypothetical protein
MNIYEKLMEARIEFHSADIKKSGWNDFSKYNYFELSDFVMPILKLCKKHKLFTKVTFTKELATLCVLDMENPDQSITFTSPMGGAALKGTHEIQQIGAVETYQRRYLYVMMMDVVEHDAIDAGAPLDPLDELDACTTLESLQDLFAALYREAKNESAKKAVKARYDKAKKAFATADGAGGE